MGGHLPVISGSQRQIIAMHRIHIGVFFLLSVALVSLQGQVDTVISVDEVIVNAQSGRAVAIGSTKIALTDSLAGMRGVDQVVSDHPFLFVKKQGLGGLATLQIRGSSAQQTLVLWNGVPIHSPLLGQLDVTLLPTFLFEKMGLVLGGSSAAWGSGAVAGVLHLESVQDEKKLSVETSLGSFGYNDQRMKYSAGSKVKSTTKMYRAHAQYNYRDRVNDRLQKNADFAQHGFMQSLTFKPDRYSLLKMHYWYQAAERGIPALITQLQSTARQLDHSHRFSTSYRRVHRSSVSAVKWAYFNERNRYVNLSHGLDASFLFSSIFAEYYHHLSLNAHCDLTVTSTFQHTGADSRSFKEVETEQRGSLLTSLLVSRSRYQMQWQLRGEKISNYHRLIWLPLIGAKFELGDGIVIRAKVSRDFRTPTLNDRFWRPGGNLDLRPEQGWSGEAGADFYWCSELFEVRFATSLFHRIIQDWILWVPNADLPFWSPQNIGKVWSRGLEQQLKAKLAIKDHQFRAQVGYQFVKSTNEHMLTLPSIQRGTQLWYVPKHQVGVDITYSTPHWTMQLSNQWRSGFSGINGDLPGFSVLDISLERAITNKIRSALRVNNVLNKDYQIVENVAMPGTHFKVDLKYTLKK